MCVCGEWNKLYSDLEPKNLLDHEKVVRPSFCIEGKTQRMTIRGRGDTWIIINIGIRVKYYG